MQNTYYFDFGAKTVPEKWRLDVDPHFEQLIEYQFLVGNYQVAPNHILCGMYKGGMRNAAVMDRKEKTIAYFDKLLAGKI